MRMTHDPDAKALYVYLADDESALVLKTVLLSKEGEPMVNVDLDKNGKPVGVEVLY